MYYSKNTKNKSFIDMWHELQRQGYSNNIFMLQTIDKDLIDFNLNDLKSLQYDQSKKKERDALVKKVVNEIVNNVWFFFREIVRIKPPITINSNYDTEYILNEDETRLIYAYNNDVSVITNNSLDNKHRGMTTTIILLNIYESYKNNIINDKNRILNSFIFNGNMNRPNIIKDNIKLLINSTSPFNDSSLIDNTNSIKLIKNSYEISDIIDKYGTEKYSEILTAKGFFYINDSLYTEEKNYFDLLSIGADRDYGLNYFRYPIYALSLLDEVKISKINSRLVKSMIIDIKNDFSKFYFYDTNNINLYKNKLILI